MASGIQGPAHAGDVGRDTGRGLVVGDEHSLDLTPLIIAQASLVFLDGHALAPFDIDAIDHEAEALSHVDPQMRKLTETRH